MQIENESHHSVMTLALAKTCTHSKIDLKQKQRRKSNSCKSFDDFWRFYSNFVNLVWHDDKYTLLDPSCNKCCDLIGHTRVSILHSKPCTSVENLVKLCRKRNSYRKPFMSKGTKYIDSC